MNAQLQPLAITRGNGQATEQSLNNAMQASIENDPSLKDDLSPFILIVILPNDGGEIKSRVKHWGDITFGVKTQCLRLSSMMNGKNQYFNNIALLLNARLGGCNSTVNAPIMKELSQQPFMVLGADVSHPGPGVLKPSAASLVWSFDRDATRYAAFLRLQSPRTEIIEDLKEMVKLALGAFGQMNRVAPHRIIFFRDGVSEGEYAQIEREEIPAIKKAIEEVWAEVKVKSSKPHLTFIIVTKRHHITLFPKENDRNSQDRKTGNVRAGCVVDEGITHPSFKDFYLQSHSAIQGTSRSSHYVVLEDGNFNDDMSKIQELAFALCHVYTKATRSVSIPAPVYYADLVCSRVAFHIHPDNSNFLGKDNSTAGGMSFDLEAWRGVFKNVHKNLKGSMYFL